MRLTSFLLAIAALIAAAIYLLRDLPPPDSIRFAAGSRDGGYWSIAEQYRDALAKDGIEVEIIETAGSVENLGLLATKRADIGLLQGGIPADGLEIVALGTVFAEPIFVFVRSDRNVPTNPALWRDLTIARGGAGSGTQVAADELLRSLGVAQVNQLVEIGGHDAADALLAGEVDMALFVAPIGAAYLQPLVLSEKVELLRLRHAEAVSLRLPHSRVATVTSGALSLDPVQPARSLPMIILLARLASVPDLHPAAVDRLVLAGRKIHGESGVFARQGEFPNTEATQMPFDSGALKLLIEGQSNFHEWLPYWIAAQIRRVLLVLLPLVFIVLPMVRMLPSLYRWSMHRRVWRYYGEIRQVEMALSVVKARPEIEALDAELSRIDRQLAAMRLPAAFRGGAYNARLHVELVRRRIAEMLEAGKAES